MSETDHIYIRGRVETLGKGGSRREGGRSEGNVEFASRREKMSEGTSLSRRRLMLLMMMVVVWEVVEEVEVQKRRRRRKRRSRGDEGLCLFFWLWLWHVRLVGEANANALVATLFSRFE